MRILKTTVATLLVTGASSLVLLDLSRDVDCTNARPYELMALGAGLMSGLAMFLLFFSREHRRWYLALGGVLVFVPLITYDILRTIGTCAN